MAAETIIEIPARRTLFGLLPAAGKLGVIEDQDNRGIGLVIGGERLYFRNVEVFDKGKWDVDTQYFSIHLDSDTGKKYTLNLGFYFDDKNVDEVFSRLQADWQDCRRQ